MDITGSRIWPLKTHSRIGGGSRGSYPCNRFLASVLSSNDIFAPMLRVPYAQTGWQIHIYPPKGKIRKQRRTRKTTERKKKKESVEKPITDAMYHISFVPVISILYQNHRPRLSTDTPWKLRQICQSYLNIGKKGILFGINRSREHKKNRQGSADFNH